MTPAEFQSLLRASPGRRSKTRPSPAARFRQVLIFLAGHANLHSWRDRTSLTEAMNVITHCLGICARPGAKISERRNKTAEFMTRCQMIAVGEIPFSSNGEPVAEKLLIVEVSRLRRRRLWVYRPSDCPGHAGDSRALA
jgi:hypothetical protein